MEAVIVMCENGRLPVGCVVMAAGLAERFGGNKLAAVVGGRSLLELALSAVPADRLDAVCVVVRDEAGEALACRYGFDRVRNDHPERGVGGTIRLGTERLRDRCGAILYMVADQPLLRRDSVAGLVDFYRAHPDGIASAAHDGVRGNPCVFPARFFDELCALPGDRGGSAVIRRHPECLLLYEVDGRELFDVDTRAALAALDMDR